MLMLASVRSLKTVPSPPAEAKPASEWKQSTVREGLWFVAREPFFQLIVLGFLIWIAVEYRNAHHDRHLITVGLAERQHIGTTYFQQFGQWATPEQLQGLIDRYIREEIFLREGLALHLDQNDEIVRRRIIQKYEFLQTDLAVPAAPDTSTLERWFELNKLRYLTPERVAFSHVYISADRQANEVAEVRALKILKGLRELDPARAPTLGDPFPGPSDVGGLAPDEAERLFGKSELSDQLFKLPLRTWSGPYRSGYGWHLVYATQHLAPVLPSLETVRDRVLTDFFDEQRRILNARNFERLRAQYTIRYGDEPR